MANHKSAIKRHRQSLKRAARNRAMKTRVRNTVKAVRAAVQLKDKDQAMALLGTASSILDKAATKGVIHWKNASRNISRLSKAISQI
ncbi:30S ribosomal protein S20 [Desulfovibrio subterraneus]|uniref:Small ribosomal subunit protein bS20 n=1 Tax=Desulfovibrio subterraneus TaxID=2718620 RepID=A0A7J0BJT5_9BACT|nr:30S ribosomal protein S20 [Desulfovibrio subterraneus]WBF68093.1 30S ribosomal protein S20 [Desulfovibrio subterraneus]GFM33976.1 30S ribosomal protein S20 [Desulfovibrio subterraneus]